MKNILLPTDFSENAWQALLVARTIAELKGASIQVMHSYLPFRSAFQSPNANVEDELRTREIAEEKMQQLKERAQSTFGSTVKVTFSCQSGVLRENLTKHHAHTPINLVVMGTTGASGAAKLIGSNTLDV